MANTPAVAWVKPPQPIQGLDHLGVLAPFTAIYTHLLPGITNATERARYYAFHPRILWSFDHRHNGDRSLSGFRPLLRRAECLFTLAWVAWDLEVDVGVSLLEGGQQGLRTTAGRTPNTSHS